MVGLFDPAGLAFVEPEFAGLRPRPFPHLSGSHFTFIPAEFE